MFRRQDKARDKQSRNALTGGDEWMTLRALEPRVLLDAAAATTAANATQHEQPPPPPDPSAELVAALAQALLSAGRQTHLRVIS
ncbi:MAG TPA: LEPR-XLL domain-containing protein [Variovorax sp.]|nr:LEPR-XLL domain-containing protein [Variovorax sp.]